MLVRELITLLQERDPESEVDVLVSIYHAREVIASEKTVNALVGMNYKPIDIYRFGASSATTTLILEDPKPEPKRRWWEFWK